MLYPFFVFGSGHGQQGFYGIQAMQLMIFITTNANRTWRCATFPGANGNPALKTATVDNFQNSILLFQFITPHASDMLDPRNVVAYYEEPVFKTTGNLALPGTMARGQASDAGTFAYPEVRAVTPSNIKLNGIPDKLIISVRKVVANLGCHQTD
ncbi:MAG: phage major capsid domain-containing protein, partial [Candidatus Fonsibacter sp.]